MDIYVVYQPAMNNIHCAFIDKERAKKMAAFLNESESLMFSYVILKVTLID